MSEHVKRTLICDGCQKSTDVTHKAPDWPRIPWVTVTYTDGGVNHYCRECWEKMLQPVSPGEHFRKGDSVTLSSNDMAKVLKEGASS